MSVVTPIQYADNFVDRSGQLWKRLEGDYIKVEGIPPIREIVLGMMLTPDGAVIRGDNQITENVNSVGITNVTNNGLTFLILIGQHLIATECHIGGKVLGMTILCDNVELLIPIIRDNKWYNIVLDSDDNYKLVDNYSLIDIDPSVNVPKLSDIKIIRNGNILTYDNDIFNIDKVSIEKFQPEFTTVDVTECNSIPVALDDNGKIWLYCEDEWEMINSRIIDMIGVREFMLLSHDDYCKDLTNYIHFIGNDGYSYGIDISKDNDVFIIEHRIPFHLLNSVGELRTKRSL